MAVNGQQLLGAARASGLIRLEDLELLDEARRARKDPVEHASSKLRLPREVFYRALAEQLGLGFCESKDLVPDTERLARLPARLLLRRGLLPIRVGSGAPVIATSDPDDGAAIEALIPLLEARPRVVVAEPEALQAALRRALGPSLAPAEQVGWDAVAFLDDMLRQAWLRRASDVHLDPQEDGMGIRLRVDGLLQPQGAILPLGEGQQLISRIKVLGGLDIAERREAQDGAFTYQLEGGRSLDIRLATIPTRHGERATLRLLGVETDRLTLDQLGFGTVMQSRFREALDQPHGLILLTGPTGSGKTTTLYAALRELARPELNVLTVEDPVEYVIPGVSQIQIDRAGKVTFARALRSLLRHDPDVLMVGEIRDGETAEVAIQSALTGHLVLSSLHTNRAVAAPIRLLDLGAEAFLLGSTLRGAVAQRLVRRICQACRRTRWAGPEELKRLGGSAGSEVYEGAGCPACLGTGFRGRLAVAEALWVDAEVARAIERRAPEEELVKLMRARDGWTLMEDALAKVMAGETTVEEAWQARA